MAYGEISDIYGDIVLSAAIMDNQQGNSEQENLQRLVSPILQAQDCKRLAVRKGKHPCLYKDEDIV